MQESIPQTLEWKLERVLGKVLSQLISGLQNRQLDLLISSELHREILSHPTKVNMVLDDRRGQQHMYKDYGCQGPPWSSCCPSCQITCCTCCPGDRHQIQYNLLTTRRFGTMGKGANTSESAGVSTTDIAMCSQLDIVKKLDLS